MVVPEDKEQSKIYKLLHINDAEKFRVTERLKTYIGTYGVMSSNQLVMLFRLLPCLYPANSQYNISSAHE